MKTQAGNLPWRQLAPESVELGAARLLYEDALPLSDLLVAPSGATCCLRRVPGKAELLAWDGIPAGKPASWTGPPELPLLRLFGFDGREVFGHTESALVRIREERVETLYETSAQIRWAGLSPDRRRVLWIEHRRKGRLCVSSADFDHAPLTLTTGGSLLHALWLPDGAVLALELRTAGEAETGVSLLRCDSNLDDVTPVFESHRWIIDLLRPGLASTQFLLAGSRHDFPRSEFSATPPPPRRTATWFASSCEDELDAVCVANASPAGGTVGLIGDTCVFADAGQQSGTESLLVAASVAAVKTAAVPAFLRDFAVVGRALLFGKLGQRRGIYSLSVEALLPS